MRKLKYSYTVQDTNNLFADDIPTRECAREELRQVKALGYSDAKIVREEYIFVTSKQVR
jgi:hypothetical protein